MEQSRVTVHEHPAQEIARLIQGEGYSLTDSLCQRIKDPKEFLNQDEIGIFSKVPVKISKLNLLERLLERVGIRKEGSVIGMLWLDNLNFGRNAKIDEHWYLEVNGREYIQELKDLVERISKPYDVKVTVFLVREKSDEKWFPHKHGMEYAF